MSNTLARVSALFWDTHFKSLDKKRIFKGRFFQIKIIVQIIFVVNKNEDFD